MSGARIDRLPSRRVRMLEKVAADEVVLVAEPAIDLAVGVQQRARVLDAAGVRARTGGPSR